MLWKVLSKFPGEDQSTPFHYVSLLPLRFSDITDFVIIRNQLRIIKHVVTFHYCNTSFMKSNRKV